MKKWRLLSAGGAWLAPGFCLVPSRLPGLGQLRFFLPFLDQRLTYTGITGGRGGLLRERGEDDRGLNGGWCLLSVHVSLGV